MILALPEFTRIQERENDLCCAAERLEKPHQVFPASPWLEMPIENHLRSNTEQDIEEVLRILDGIRQ